MFGRFKNLLRIRYSVRGLLIVVTLVCLAAGAFAVRVQSAKRQAAAARSLEDGLVIVGYDYMLDKLENYTGHAEPPGGTLRQYLGNDFFSKVIRVEYPTGPLPKCGLSPLADVWGLRHLSLRGTSARDDDIR